jgi:PKHD-type hydroxylase
MKSVYWVWENELPHEVCDRLILENRHNLEVAKTVGPQGEDMVVDRRRSKLNFDVTTEAKEMCLHYTWAANKHVFGFNLFPNENYRNFNAQFTEYNAEEKGHFDWHMDTYIHGSSRSNRKLTLICSLSDPKDYEGGGLDIGYGDVPPLRLSKGSIVVFPSYMLHRIRPVTVGRRNSFVSWVEGPEWV